MDKSVEFDFIQHADLRSSLESDFRELLICNEHGAWKATMVLAGSMVEAILLDYLVAEQKISVARGSHEPFEKLILISHEQGLIKDRTRDQALLIKEFRNLIHQGRILRLEESCDDNTAVTALALVRMITTDISAKRRREYGPTAEEFCAKVQADPINRSIWQSLAKSMKPPEITALLVKVLPEAAFEQEPVFAAENDPFVDERELEKGNEEAFSAVLNSYHFVFDLASEVQKKDAVAKIAQRVKLESGSVVESLMNWFFKIPYLAYANESDRHLLVGYLLERLDKQLVPLRPERLRGLQQYVADDQVDGLLRCLTKAATTGGLPPGTTSFYWSSLESACATVNERQVNLYKRSLKILSLAYRRRNMPNTADRLLKIKVEYDYDPFDDE